MSWSRVQSFRTLLQIVGAVGKHKRMSPHLKSRPSTNLMLFDKHKSIISIDHPDWYRTFSTQASEAGNKEKRAASSEPSPIPETKSVEVAGSNPDRLYKSIELEVLAYEPSVLNSYEWFVLTAANHLNIQLAHSWRPPRSHKYRFPLLKSAFVHKKHQVHYEIRTHHMFLIFKNLTGSTADTFLEYVQRNLPEGVGMKVTRVELKPLPDYVK